MGDLNTTFSAEGIDLSLDSDNNGVESTGIFGSWNEIYEEILKRGNAVEDYKIVEIKTEGLQASLHLDTDKDGEPAMIFRINVMESINEAIKRF